MTQYYVFEIQQSANGTYSYIVNQESDVDPRKARMKGESRYHTVLAAAAISELPTHAALLCDGEGKTIMHECYYHTQEAAEE